MNFRLGKLGNKLYRSIIISTIIIILFSIIAAIAVRYSLNTNIQGQRSLDAIQDTATELYQSMLDQETGQRGYSLSNNITYLDPYYKGTESFEKNSEQLIKQTKQFDNLGEYAQNLVDLGEKWHLLSEELIESAQQGNEPDLTKMYKGKLLLDEFRAKFSTLTVYIDAERSIVRNTMQFRINFTLISLVSIVILVMGINMYLKFRSLRSVINPIIELNHCVKKYTEHDFSQGVPIYSNKDELAELIQNVDVMRKELSESIHSLRSKVNVDELTGLYNRRFFNEYYTEQWELAKSSSQNLSVIMFDVDHYKKFNDTYGHLTGDECLQKISNCVTSMSNVQFVARYGGEEFVVLLINKTKEESMQVAENIRQAIVDLNIPHSSSPTHPYVTVSLGVSMTVPANNMYSDELIAMADKALYCSKQKGRNRVSFYNEELETT